MIIIDGGTTSVVNPLPITVTTQNGSVTTTTTTIPAPTGLSAIQQQAVQQVVSAQLNIPVNTTTVTNSLGTSTTLTLQPKTITTQQVEYPNTMDAKNANNLVGAIYLSILEKIKDNFIVSLKKFWYVYAGIIAVIVVLVIVKNR